MGSRSEIWNVFIADGMQCLEEMESALLVLDQGVYDLDAMQKIRRVLHTLKGNSSMMGLSQFMFFMHTIEDFVDCIGQVGLQQEESPIALLFAILDVMQQFFGHLLEKQEDIEEQYTKPLIQAIEYWVQTWGQKSKSFEMQSSDNPSKSIQGKPETSVLDGQEMLQDSPQDSPQEKEIQTEIQTEIQRDMKHTIHPGMLDSALQEKLKYVVQNEEENRLRQKKNREEKIGKNKSVKERTIDQEFDLFFEGTASVETESMKIVLRLNFLLESFQKLCSLDEHDDVFLSLSNQIEQQIQELSHWIPAENWRFDAFSIEQRDDFLQHIESLIEEQKQVWTLQQKMDVHKEEHPKNTKKTTTASLEKEVGSIDASKKIVQDREKILCYIDPIVKNIIRALEQYEHREIAANEVCIDIQRLVVFASEFHFPRIQIAAERLALAVITESEEDIILQEEELFQTLADIDIFFEVEDGFYQSVMAAFHFRSVVSSLMLVQNMLEMEGQENNYPHIIQRLQSISRSAGFMDDEELQNIYICFQDAIARYFYGEKVDIHLIVELIVGFGKSMISYLQGDLEFDDFEREKKKNTMHFRRIVQQEIPQDDLIEKLGIPQDLLTNMTSEASTKLHEAIESERFLLLLQADLEYNSYLSGRFANWLQKTSLVVITSGTIYIEERTAFLFLIDSAMAPALVKLELLQIDPSGMAFSIQICSKPNQKEQKEQENHQLHHTKKKNPSIDLFQKNLSKKLHQSIEMSLDISSSLSVLERARDPSKSLIAEMKSHNSSEKILSIKDSQNVVESSELPDVWNKQKSKVVQEPVSIKAQGDVLRVDVDKIIKIMDLAGEIGLAFGTIVHHPLIQHIDDLGFQSSIRRLHTLIIEMQDLSLGLRLVSISSLFQRMKRVVRDAALQTNKTVHLHIVGDETELDKVMIEHLQSPLIHIIRNAIDHGLETSSERLLKQKTEHGNIWLTAAHQGSEIHISIRDDGRGLQREQILQKAIDMGLLEEKYRERYRDDDIFSCILATGFSTKEQVNALSGRGIGLDVVRSEIQSIKGSISIRSKEDEGTEFRIILPLTVAFLEGMLVECAQVLYIIPIDVIQEVIWVSPEDIHQQKQYLGTFLMIRNEVIPLIELREFYHQNIDGHKGSQDSKKIVVIVKNSTNTYGIIVDRLEGQEQVVIKPLERPVNKLRAISSFGILQDGRIGITLDVEGLYVS